MGWSAGLWGGAGKLPDGWNKTVERQWLGRDGAVMRQLVQWVVQVKTVMEWGGSWVGG